MIIYLQDGSQTEWKKFGFFSFIQSNLPKMRSFIYETHSTSAEEERREKKILILFITFNTCSFTWKHFEHRTDVVVIWKTLCLTSLFYTKRFSVFLFCVFSVPFHFVVLWAQLNFPCNPFRRVSYAWALANFIYCFETQ